MKKFLSFFLIFIMFYSNVFAASRISLVRDTEIEDFLYEISVPIFRTAGLNSKDIRFFVVNDNAINAFVMGGQNIFINTGTLTSFDTPDAVLGIIAHETGHIAGGHLVKFNEQIKNAQAVSIGSILLGIGSLIAGVPELGQVIIFGGMQTQQQSILSYTRSQEEIADDLAIQYLNNNEMSGNALLISMNKFYMNELQYSSEVEYYLTHPLSRNRMQFIENKVKKEKYSNDKFNKIYGEKFNFIKAKILAYNLSSGSDKFNMNVPKGTDYEKYANSIVNMNKNNVSLALKDVNYLISKYKNNPYFYELKGDIYFKDGNIKSALVNYNIANDMLKNNTLIKKMIAFIIIKYKQKDMYRIAINNLNYVVQNDDTDNSALKLLAEAHYNNGDLSLSYLSLAKYYMNLKDESKAKNYLKLAEENTKDASVLNRIEDLKVTLKK